MERAGPSKRSVPAVSLVLLPTTRCRSLHRRVSRSFWRGRFGCVAAPAVAMPESDLEVTAMLSRATGRVGLEWRKKKKKKKKATVSRTLEVGRLVSRGSVCWFSAPCPGCLSPGRAWGAYRSWTAPFTARNRPANSSSLTTLGGAARGYGGPPVERSVAMQVCPYTVSTRQGKPCLLFRACRYSSGLIRRGLCGLWRGCLHLMLRRYCRFFSG